MQIAEFILTIYKLMVKILVFVLLYLYLCLLQPIAVTDTEVERPSYTPSDYTNKFIILLIWLTVAFLICWLISLITCCLTCAVSPLCLFVSVYTCGHVGM